MDRSHKQRPEVDRITGPRVDEVEDWLPEQARYRDEGCRAHPSCLNCPLPRCLYEQGMTARRHIQGQRDQEIARLFRQGETVGQLAHRFQLSERTVYRILRRSRR